MENRVLESVPRISEVAVNAHCDFRLEGWPASAVFITLCLSGVMIYGIKMWSEMKQINASYVKI